MELHNSPQPFAQPSGWDADTALPTGEAGQGWGCVAPRRSDTSYSCSERSAPSAPEFPTPLRTASYTDEVGGESLGLRMASRPPVAPSLRSFGLVFVSFGLWLLSFIYLFFWQRFGSVFINRTPSKASKRPLFPPEGRSIVSRSHFHKAHRGRSQDRNFQGKKIAKPKEL